MLKNYLFSPLCSAPFLCSSPLFLFLSAPHTSFFLFCFLVSRHFSSSLFFQPSFSFLQVCCPLFFSPNVFQLFSPKRFCFSPKLSSVQPKTFFFFFQFSHSSSSSFMQTCCSFKFSLLFFQRLLFFFFLAPFIQGPIFSLAASHLFYLNKFLFSSNLG